MAVHRALLRWSVLMCVSVILDSVDSIAFHQRERWIAIGDEIKEVEAARGIIEVENYNVSYPVSTITAEISYRTNNGKMINAVIATSSKMNGFVSLENGGIEQDHVTVKYTNENTATDAEIKDEFYVFVQSYKIKEFVINDNLAKMKSQTVVTNDIRNWTNRNN